MMDAEKRRRETLQNRYDDAGNLVEQYTKVWYSNETDEKVFITYEWVMNMLKDAKGKGTSAGDFSNREKEYYYENGDFAVRITGYTSEHNNGIGTYVFKKLDGSTFKVTNDPAQM